MPKKFSGENSKAAVARARKSAAKDEEQAAKKKQLDDEYWKENDKHVLRKQQRKDEQERKKYEVANRKAEAKALLDQEMSTIKKIVKALPPAEKITRAQISENIASAGTVKKEKEKVETHLDVPLEENLNRLTVDGEEAHTILEAISILNSQEPELDKHPEKRMKAAYLAFEEHRLKALKTEFPSLRLSQLKQMIFKEWQKAPENPLNEAK